MVVCLCYAVRQLGDSQTDPRSPEGFENGWIDRLSLQIVNKKKEQTQRK